MKKWVRITLNFKYIILAISAFCVLFYEQFSLKKELILPQKKIQEIFLQQELKIKQAAPSVLHYFKDFGAIPPNENCQIHLYKNDRLVKWNTNKIPVSNFSTIQFPSSGLMKLQNGWYYGEVYKEGEYTCCASFCLAQEYSYSNEFINSHPNPLFGKTKFSVSLDMNRGVPIFNAAKQYCFSIIANELPSEPTPWYILPLFLIGLVSLLYGIYKYIEHHKTGRWLFLIGLIVFRSVLFEVHLNQLFEQASFHSAELFAYNEWFPSFLDFCINSIFIAFGFLSIFKSFKETENSYFTWIQYLAIYGVWMNIIYLIKMVVLHSSIPVNFNQFFDLNSQSFVFFAIIGFNFLCYQKMLFGMIEKLEGFQLKGTIVLIASVVLIFVYWIIGGPTDFSYFTLILPFIVIFVNLLFYRRKESMQQFSFQLVLLCLFSFVFVQELIEKNEQKELENRSIYAKKIATERDVNLEIEYSEIQAQLVSDRIFHQFQTEQTSLIEAGTLNAILEKRYFHGVWDGYDLSFDVINAKGISFFSKEQYAYQQLNEFIALHGKRSDINPSIYFMPHEEEGLTYVILQKIKLEEGDVFLSIRLKSKRIPEEIGFPRLLISAEANVIRDLEEYSIGKYAEGNLIHQSGSYNYPVAIFSLLPVNKMEGTFKLEGYNHYFYKNSNQNAIVISIMSKSWFDYITSFAYIFSFWGMLMVVIYLINGKAVIKGIDLSFAFKIQIAFILVLVLSLLLYGIGSGVFVGKQYEEFTRSNIQDKLSSIQEELKTKVAKNTSLNSMNDRQHLQTSLHKLSAVFHTDLNVYDNKGMLVASSRPKIFDLGLISEQMNPIALRELQIKNKSSFSHSEDIGKLSFISAYLPIYNEKRKEIGYVNLQHFGQQQAYENQIETFVTSIINVFILLLALSVIIGLVVSNWLIEPLIVLKKHMSTIQFGKENKHIKYQQKDEIGAIVQAYNDKLDELKIAAQKLASTEREIAWREMAQQIAHEIKNPLTPMKLSIQHLLRSYDPKNEEGEKQLNRVLHSIIEQIDGLTRMANEFSTFAKMPEAMFQRANMVEIIETVLNLYENEQGIAFLLNKPNHEVFVNVDRNLWIQVIVNLLQNAQQALIGRDNGVIHVRISVVENQCFIQVVDNGCGISREESVRIFTPHFTTKSSGSGIGLSLVKQIVEKHGGSISFTSKENEGTTFQLELPTVD
jgi:two-component system nitrogen regulation sensor histidine kinase NtrY